MVFRKPRHPLLRLASTIYVAMLLSIGHQRGAHATDEGSACHNWTRDQWIAFRREYVSKISNSAESRSYPPPDAQFNPLVDGFARSVMQECKVEVRTLGLSSCFENLNDYLDEKYRILGPNRGYGFKVSDEEYLKSQPEYMQSLPPQYTSTDPEVWKKTAIQEHVPYIEFTSQLQNEVRYVFHETKDGIDRYILGFKDDPSIDMIGVDSRNALHAKVYFREYDRSPANGALKLRDHPMACILCHPNGTRSIVPEPGSEKTDFIAGIDKMGQSSQRVVQNRLKTFNDSLEYGFAPDWAGLLDGKAAGPSYGSDGYSGCSSCHNDYTRARLSGLMDPQEIRRKVMAHQGEAYSKGDGTMPPLGDGLLEELTSEKRAELVTHLFDSHNASLGKWLTQDSCSSLGERTVRFFESMISMQNEKAGTDSEIAWPSFEFGGATKASTAQ